MGAQGKRVRGAGVGEGRAEKRRWERRGLGIGGGAENSGELPDEDQQAQRESFIEEGTLRSKQL